MEWLGLGMLLAVGAGSILTGLPIWSVLLAVSVSGVGLALALGKASLPIFAVLPGRLIGLLESDLLQALPLFVAMGALLNRLPLADTLYRAGFRLLGAGPRAASVSGLLLGALLSPMNGSVSANAVALTKVLDPALHRRGLPAPQLIALIAVASTLGVLVPPSLVLILLGDAMMAAHTIAVNASGSFTRIINTQDVFRGALIPALMLLAGYLGIALWRTHGDTQASERSRAESHLTRREWAEAAITVGFIVSLLAGVAMGYFYAVEAAAMGAVGLVVAGFVSGHLTAERWKAILDDTITMTGALFALLVAATTFTLAFRVFQSDQLIAKAIAAVPGGSAGVVLVGLVMIGVAAFVLDAFEIIFVLVPILLPPILMRVEDATWMAVLVLMVLQTSFLLPPLGYALVMTRAEARENAPVGAIVRALVPFFLVQVLVLGLVAAFPRLTHGGAEGGPAGRPAPFDAGDIGAKMRTMIPGAAEDLPPPKF